MANTAINTFSGEHLDFDHPDPGSIKLGDIAHGLSFVPRFGAQALVFRSVAQHAVLVLPVISSATVMRRGEAEALERSTARTAQ
jgi:uncharacterized protein